LFVDRDNPGYARDDRAERPRILHGEVGYGPWKESQAKKNRVGKPSPVRGERRFAGSQAA
jgi:hypothetical protein